MKDEIELIVCTPLHHHHHDAIKKNRQSSDASDVQLHKNESSFKILNNQFNNWNNKNLENYDGRENESTRNGVRDETTAAQRQKVLFHFPHHL